LIKISSIKTSDTMFKWLIKATAALAILGYWLILSSWRKWSTQILVLFLGYFLWN